MSRFLNMIDNYLYLYHMNEIIVIPSFADSITDSIAPHFASEIPLSRSAPIYSYQNSGPRHLNVTFDLHRELMWQVNYKVSSIKPDAGDDYVDYMIKAVQAAALPQYSLSEKMVNPPVVALKLGNDIFIKGVITGEVGVTYGFPIIPGINPDGTPDNSISRYAAIRIAFAIEEIDPYQASEVMQQGSFRGLSKTLERMTQGDVGYESTKNTYNTTQKAPPNSLDLSSYNSSAGKGSSTYYTRA